eukprot:Gb_05795 [translate_table: standard]
MHGAILTLRTASILMKAFALAYRIGNNGQLAKFCYNAGKLRHEARCSNNHGEAMTNLTDSYLSEENKLDGVNYVNWKFKMQTLMEGYNVWTIVSGTEGKPATPIASVQVRKKERPRQSLAAREKAPSFDDLTCIPMQEEERRKNVESKQQILDLALMAKGKQPYKGKPWVKNKGCKPDVKMYQGGASSKTDTNVKKYGTCNYCDDIQKEDSQDSWKLPKEGIKSAKEEEVEDQQDNVESQSSIEATSNKDTPRSSETTPSSSKALRKSIRQIKTPISFSILSCIFWFHACRCALPTRWKLSPTFGAAAVGANMKSWQVFGRLTYWRFHSPLVEKELCHIGSFIVGGFTTRPEVISEKHHTVGETSPDVVGKGSPTAVQ